jgi:two-component SAPR family response regulator
MSDFHQQLQELQTFQENAKIRIETLGNFGVWRNQQKIETKEWTRDKTIQLLQYLVSNRQRNALHKEKIMDGLWEDWNDRDFKVALHGINKVLEPERPSRTEALYIIRQGVSYQINLENVWIDVEALEKYIIIGN